MTQVEKGHSRVAVDVFLPDDLLLEFLQHVRDFDARHYDAVTMSISANCPGMTTDRLKEILGGIRPPFDTLADFRLDR